MQRDRSPLQRDTSEPPRKRRINGTAVFPGVDGRTIQAKRFQLLLGGFAAEFESFTEPDKCLIRNAAFLVLKCEDMQARPIRGKPVDGDEVIRLSGQLNRSMSALKRRQAADVPTAPSIASHWDANHEENDDNDEGGQA